MRKYFAKALLSYAHPYPHRDTLCIYRRIHTFSLCVSLSLPLYLMCVWEILKDITTGLMGAVNKLGRFLYISIIQTCYNHLNQNKCYFGCKLQNCICYSFTEYYWDKYHPSKFIARALRKSFILKVDGAQNEYHKLRGLGKRPTRRDNLAFSAIDFYTINWLGSCS